jgi:hypothetical protein
MPLVIYFHVIYKLMAALGKKISRNVQEKFENIKGVMKSLKLTKDRKYNDQKKRDNQ